MFFVSNSFPITRYKLNVYLKLKIPKRKIRNFPISFWRPFFGLAKSLSLDDFCPLKNPTIEWFIPLRPGGPCDNHFGLHLCCDRNLCSMSTIQPEVGAVGWMVRTVLGVSLWCLSLWWVISSSEQWPKPSFWFHCLFYCAISICPPHPWPGLIVLDVEIVRESPHQKSGVFASCRELYYPTNIYIYTDCNQVL